MTTRRNVFAGAFASFFLLSDSTATAIVTGPGVSSVSFWTASSFVRDVSPHPSLLVCTSIVSV